MNIIVDPGALMTIIAIVAGITIFSFIRSRHIERMLQLQLGIPIDGPVGDFFTLKMGLLSIGIGSGILAAYILEYIFSRGIDELYPALIFLFGGIGLIASFMITSRYKEKM